MPGPQEFISALNNFIHEWSLSYTNVELKYAYIEGEETGDGITKYVDEHYMYIIWANSKQSRIYITDKSNRQILMDFLHKNYEDVPEDEYI